MRRLIAWTVTPFVFIFLHFLMNKMITTLYPEAWLPIENASRAGSFILGFLSIVFGVLIVIRIYQITED